MVDVTSKHGERADRLIADEKGRGQHGTQATARGKLPVLDPRVVIEIRALDGAPELHGRARDALPDFDPDSTPHRLQVETRRGLQLTRGRVEREQTTGLDTEHLTRLIQDQLDGLADIQALVDRVASLEQRLRLARAPLALLEQPGVLDGDARLVREALEQRLMARREEAGDRRKRRDHTDDFAGDTKRNAQHRADAFL